MSPASIRGSLTLTILLGAAVVVFALGFFLDRLTSSALQASFDEDLLHRSQALIALVKLDDQSLDEVSRFMPEFERSGGKGFFEIHQANGGLLKRSESLQEQPLGVDFQVSKEPVFRDFELVDVGFFRLLTVSFELEREAATTLLLGYSRDDFDGLLTRIRGLIWGSLALMLLVLLLLVRYASGRGLRPLQDISGQMEAVDPDAPDTQIHLVRPVKELESVVQQLNVMLGRHGELLERERRFTSDVAHELRTPLAELRSLTEVGMRDPDDREMIIEFLSDIRDITLEMQQLVTNLLELTRCDSGVVEPKPGEVNLVAVIDKSWRRAEVFATERKVSLNYQAGEPVFVMSDRHMLEQIVQNLINNAVKHGPRGCTVRIQVLSDERHTELTISNPAPLLQAEDIPRLFERFWQKDSARTGGASSGLGLSLVAAMSNMLNIKVSTELVGGDLHFRLVF